MICPKCDHRLCIKENKNLNFFYIGCKKCDYSIPKNYYYDGEWFKTKAEASQYKKNLLYGRKRYPNLG